jgi:ATP-dependent RNA helicase RhlE
VEKLLQDPVRIAVAPQVTTAERVEQHVLFVSRDDKRALLQDVLSDAAVSRAIVFARTKHGADKLARWLESAGISTDSIHGDKSQAARQRALWGFRDGRTRVLVATDVAARGIDIDDISHVINYDLPVEPENYVHRIGRTGRAGAEGIALTFCDAEERGALRGIERIIKQQIPVMTDHPYHLQMSTSVSEHQRPRRRPTGRPNRRPGAAGNGRPIGAGKGRAFSHADQAAPGGRSARRPQRAGQQRRFGSNDQQ